MLTVNVDQTPQVVDNLNPFIAFPAAVEVKPDPQMEKLLAALSSDTPWGDREMAAKKLGYLRRPEAVPGLLAALPADPFWMVRCAIIQALEMIDDPTAVPTLRGVANSDGFQVVRSYAAKAVERLS